MTTEKLYYQDQYLGRFTANVLHSGKDEAGQFYVVLDQTAFYPTGGGQPHDTGTLNNVQVFNVEEIDGEIRHYLSEEIDASKECVGEINWDRRMDHMQQHAGQHILTAAFEEEFGIKTVSFHLGKEICSIDLATDQLSEERAIEVEKIANLIIIENRPIETRWVTEEELANYKLRKELAVSENIRLVIIPDFDYNGCGGTHPKSTGQVGSIEILHWEKQKSHIRLYFVCGRRVRQQLHEKHLVIQKLTTLLSAPQEQLEDTTKRLLEQTKDLEKTIFELKNQIIEYEANSYIEKVLHLDGNYLIKDKFHNRSITEIQQLAKYITARTNRGIVLFVNETEEKLQLVCARGSDVSLSMNHLVKSILPTINGKGGGSDSIAQGGGDKLVPAEELLEMLVNPDEKY
ncbi:serine-tRNA(Ala) deacylase AlaX [Ornithinibacillus californiensis]|uniref:serine-tRNA(Ala) deacylase AlaX n=1 Tax=Ornithinibacillus californiensis TaxID=161536 RepID=UPI00064D90FB|nr:serine-tRNA(Ala) deacylase AlaX [Ornithinibacillus californiensis]